MRSVFPVVIFAFFLSPALYAPTEELFGNYHFVLEVDGIVTGAFSEVSGLRAELEVIEYMDGDDLVLRKRPGRAKYGNITLRRGFARRSPVLEWFERISSGAVESRDVNIILYDDQSRLVGTWKLTGCWPKQWKVGDLKSGDPALVEEIVLVTETLTFEEPPPLTK